MTKLHVPGAVKHERKVHILVYNEDVAGPRRFCKPGLLQLHMYSRDGHTGPASDFCRACLREYRAWRLRYGHGEIETVEE